MYPWQRSYVPWKTKHKPLLECVLTPFGDVHGEGPIYAVLYRKPQLLVLTPGSRPPHPDGPPLKSQQLMPHKLQHRQMPTPFAMAQTEYEFKPRHVRVPLLV